MLKVLCLDFFEILPKFSTNQNFWWCVFTPFLSSPINPLLNDNPVLAHYILMALFS